MPQVIVKENESFEGALRKFKKAVEKAGVITESRERRAYKKRTKLKQEKKQAAIKRFRRGLRAKLFPRQHKRK